MEGVALDAGAGSGGGDEGEGERRIVAEQNRAGAIGGAHRAAERLKDALQGSVLRQRRTKWVIGVDTRKGKRGWSEAGARERQHVTRKGFVAMEATVLVQAERDGGNFQQRIGLRIEAARLHIDGDRQVAPVTVGESRDAAALHGHSIRDSTSIGDVTIATTKMVTACKSHTIGSARRRRCY